MKRILVTTLIAANVVLFTNATASAEMINKEVSKSNSSYNNNLVVKNDENNVKNLINQFYLGFLGRDGDQGGLDYWTSEIINGNKTVSNVLEIMINSDEFKAKNYTNEEFVQATFKSLFNRTADESGLKYWTNFLNSGNSKRFMLSKNIESSEFNSILDNIGIKNKGTIKITLEDKRGEVKNLVNQFYLGFLGRNGDQGGLDYWTSEIINGNKTVSNVLEIMINSDEFKSKNYTNQEFVQATFKSLFNRTADESGLKYWTNFLNSGNSKRFMLSKNIESSEFNSILDNIGIKNKGTITVTLEDKRGEAKNLVNQFYLGFLGRDGDQSGLDYWTNEIVSGHQTVAKVLESMINSDEFKSKNYTNEQVIKCMFKGVLGREADESGLNYWLNQLISGKSNKYILNEILNSNEFLDKLNEIGIKNKGNITLTDKDISSTVAKARIIDEPMNLRDKPSQKHSNVLKTMPIGADVVVLDRVKGDIPYYKVKYVNDGKVYEGYVSVYFAGATVVELYQDNSTNEFLGVLSEKYESNGNPGAISDTPGDFGGKSYGAWQLSAKTGSLDSFVNWLKDKNYEFYKQLTDARNLDANTNCGPNFDSAWRNIANNHYNTFYYLQQQYTKEAFYDALLMKLVKTGDYSKILSSFAARNVIWSTVVQHGVAGAYNIIANKVNETNDVEAFIKGVYAERGRRRADGELVHFYSSSKAVQESVARRFIREEKEALKMYRFANE
ncbi:DUF4214 domain-containing protein [Clostridium perfringens]|uniref:DUF4214 domain-containing protein n=2 Tax=Clostridium perfringens TaxID=1502 RepID=UPI0034A3D7B2